jgi:hypothetical protein
MSGSTVEEFVKVMLERATGLDAGNKVKIISRHCCL